MQKRAIRFTVVALLLIAGVGAGFLSWILSSRLSALDARRTDVASRLDHLLTTVGEIGAAQHAYVAPGQSVPESFDQVASLIQRVHADIQTVRPLLESAEAAELLTMMTDSTATLVEVDGSARSHYRNGETLWAAEVIFGQASDTLATMTQTVRALQAAETRTQSATQAQLHRSLVTVVGGAALLWTVGLVALAWTPRQRSAPRNSSGEQTAAVAETIDPVISENPDTLSPEAPSHPAVDLTAAARVCTGISRLNASSALPPLLAQAAQVLDATGIIIWMGAGDELFAAAAHGYDPRIVARLGSISRSADNATAAAWRTGRPGQVAGGSGSNGAIVAPMFSPDGCIGVLAAEVREGREADPATRAVTTMLAAQLATVVTAWPAASAAPAAPAKRPEAPPLREASGL